MKTAEQKINGVREKGKLFETGGAKITGLQRHGARK